MPLSKICIVLGMDNLFGSRLTSLIYSILLEKKGDELTVNQIYSIILKKTKVNLSGSQIGQFKFRLREQLRKQSEHNKFIIRTAKKTELKTTYYTYKIKS